MNIGILTQPDEAAYTEFVLRHDQSSIVSSLLFRDFLAIITSPSIPYYFIAKEGSEIVGVLPAFLKKGKYGPVLNSLPWFGSNPGVITDEDDVAIYLVESFLKAAEWTKCLSATIIASPFDKYEWVYELCYGQQAIIDRRVATVTTLPEFVDMEDFTIRMMDKLHSKTRNQVRKSYNECFSAVCNPNIPLNDNSFYGFLQDTHKENMAVMSGPAKKQEFGIIGDQWAVGKDINLYVSRQKETGHNTAALLVAYFNKTVDYWVPVIDVKYRHLNPLHILIFEAMKDAASRGFKYWNWGGSLIPGMEDLLHFKQRFGGESQIYRYYTWLPNTISSDVTVSDLISKYPYFFVLPFRLLGQERNLGGAQANHNYRD